MIKAIVCLSRDGGIGLNGKLLFDLPKDLAYFAKQTKGGCVVMGNNTYKSLPMYPKGLPNRDNLILCSKEDDVFLEYDSNLEYYTQRGEIDYVDIALNEDHRKGAPVWLIGGKSIYELYEHLVDEWRITLVDSSPEADTYFEPNLTDFELVEQECVSSEELNAQVGVYRRINNNEEK